MKHLLKFLSGIAILLVGCAQQDNSVKFEQMDTVRVVDNLVIDDNSVPIFPKKAALTTDTARHFSIELPKRCTVDWDNQSVVSVVPEEKIEMVRLDLGDPLPELNVSDYDFQKLTVSQALNKLLDGTNIDVVEQEQMFEKISGSIASGNLSDAVNLMTKSYCLLSINDFKLSIFCLLLLVDF